VALVIHADFKLRLLETFLELASAESWLRDVANTSISKISARNGRWKLDYWNVVSHLEREEITF
jgi:broad specificity phosphatase PhoE